MRIVVRDHTKNRREVYNVRELRNRSSRFVDDSDDDKIKDLEERVKALEKEIKELTAKDDDKESDEPEDEIDVEEDELDEVEEPEEDKEDDEEKVEDLGDCYTFGDSVKQKKSLRSVGSLAKKSTANDSIDDGEAEIKAWATRPTKPTR